MKMLKAIWISAMPQPCAWCIGLTNSVHAYCRLAISTMHNTPSQSCNHRFAPPLPVLLPDMETSPKHLRLISL
jgi:hypothetical protein